jgi:two-component system cell cycle response regulator CtrA
MSGNFNLSVSALCDRLEQLQHENALLRKLLMPVESIPFVLGLSRKEGETLAILLRSSPRVVNKGAILDALYLLDTPHPKVVDVMVCEVRKKLKPFGITIETVHGIGYVMNDYSAHRLRAMSGVS